MSMMNELPTIGIPLLLKHLNAHLPSLSLDNPTVTSHLRTLLLHLQNTSFSPSHLPPILLFLSHLEKPYSPSSPPPKLHLKLLTYYNLLSPSKPYPHPFNFPPPSPTSSVYLSSLLPRLPAQPKPALFLNYLTSLPPTSTTLNLLKVHSRLVPLKSYDFLIQLYAESLDINDPYILNSILCVLLHPGKNYNIRTNILELIQVFKSNHSHILIPLLLKYSYSTFSEYVNELKPDYNVLNDFCECVEGKYIRNEELNKIAEILFREEVRKQTTTTHNNTQQQTTTTNDNTLFTSTNM
jgi:hypothetical protein